MIGIAWTFVWRAVSNYLDAMVGDYIENAISTILDYIDSIPAVQFFALQLKIDENTVDNQKIK